MKKSYISRKDNIILTAIEIVDELGLQGLTIREIAGRENVTEAAIYRHFKSKEEIILGVLEKYSYFDLMIKNTIVDQNYKAKEAILFFIKSYVEYYENYPAITAILFAVEAFRSETYALQRMKEILDERLSFLEQIIEDGKIQGELNNELPAENLAYLIYGMVVFMTQMWRTENYGFSLKDKTMSTLSAILKNC